MMPQISCHTGNLASSDQRPEKHRDASCLSTSHRLPLQCIGLHTKSLRLLCGVSCMLNSKESCSVSYLCLLSHLSSMDLLPEPSKTLGSLSRVPDPAGKSRSSLPFHF